LPPPPLAHQVLLATFFRRDWPPLWKVHSPSSSPFKKASIREGLVFFGLGISRNA
jgi:hypothetical protein